MIKYIIIANLAFLFGSYLEADKLLGEPKPLGYHIPLFKTDAIDNKKIPLVGVYWNNEYIYMMLLEDTPKLYVMKYNEELIFKLKRRIDENHGSLSGINVSFTDYGDADSASRNIDLNEPIPVSHLPKLLAPDVEDY